MDPQDIARTLSGVVFSATESDQPGYSVRLLSIDRGVRLRLELTLQMDEVTLYVDMFTRNIAKIAGKVSLHDVQSIICDEARGEVRFVSSSSELMVNASALFTVSVL